MVEYKGTTRPGRRHGPSARVPCRTHRFAQARSVFAVATQRCAELFSPPGCVTLWALPAAIEDEFEERWQQWLDDYSAWEPFFLKVESLSGTDLLSALRGHSSWSPTAPPKRVGKLKRSAQGLGVPLPGAFTRGRRYSGSPRGRLFSGRSRISSGPLRAAGRLKRWAFRANMLSPRSLSRRGP